MLNVAEKVSLNTVQVLTTMDYSLFKNLNGNREVNQLHLKRLKASMSKNPLITIIMVNERFEIIDGQHRFLASKELNLPVYYTISQNYGLNEIQILNANMKNWQTDDYVNGYCDLGNQDYIVYRDFVTKYKLPSRIAILLLSGEQNTTGEVTTGSKFKDGLFKVKDLDEAKKMAERLLMLAPYYEGFNRRCFALAICGIMKNPKFDFEEFILKLKQQPTALQDCVNITQYKTLIEDIYNYRRREKVNLRF